MKEKQLEYPEGQILGISWEYIMGKESTQEEKIYFANAITEIVIKYMDLREEKAYNDYASLSVFLEKNNGRL